MLANRPGVKSHLGCFPWGNIGKTHQKPIKNPLISGVKRHMWISHGFFLPRKRDRCRKETLGTTSCFKLVPQSDQLTFQSCAEYFLLAMRVEGTPSLQPGFSYIDGIGFKCFISAQFFWVLNQKFSCFTLWPRWWSWCRPQPLGFSHRKIATHHVTKPLESAESKPWRCGIWAKVRKSRSKRPACAELSPASESTNKNYQFIISIIISYHQCSEFWLPNLLVSICLRVYLWHLWAFYGH